MPESGVQIPAAIAPGPAVPARKEEDGRSVTLDPVDLDLTQQRPDNFGVTHESVRSRYVRSQESRMCARIACAAAVASWPQIARQII